MNTAERLEVSMKPTHIDTRVALLELSISHINETMLRIEKKFDKNDDRFNETAKKFDLLDNKIEKLCSKIDSTTKWLIGIVLSVLISGISIAISLFQIFQHS